MMNYRNGIDGAHTIQHGDNSWTHNDIIGVALDLDNRKFYFSKMELYQNWHPAQVEIHQITLLEQVLGNFYSIA